ncbi:hypothetical protein GCM10027421_09550 [Microbacterium shaanxiense]
MALQLWQPFGDDMPRVFAGHDMPSIAQFLSGEKKRGWAIGGRLEKLQGIAEVT